MKRIFFALVIFVVLLITFTGCMSTRHLGYQDPAGVDHSNHGSGNYSGSGSGGHSNHGGGNYSGSGGGSHSGGCH